ncbi:12997_t:CDS:2 [Gigaspora rosea]|nr:12997_t:CDS:2 [Gigaspora rosea]
MSLIAIRMNQPEKSPPLFSTISMSGSYFSVLSNIKSAILKAMRNSSINLSGFIPSSMALKVQQFLLNTEGLNRLIISEYLGEGDFKREAYQAAFQKIVNKTELIQGYAESTILRRSRIDASSAGLSDPLQDIEDLKTANFVVEGFKLAIYIRSFFDIEL